MATVVYEKGNTGIDKIGEAIGQLFDQQKQQQQQQEELKAASALLNAINSAKSRGDALDVVAKSAGSVVKNPQDINMLFKMVDEKHPQTDETPIKSTLYDPVHGEPTDVFAKRDDLPKLSDPNFRAGLGPGYENLTPSKPKTRVYINPKTYDVQQLTDQAATLFPGYVPKDAFELQNQQFSQEMRLRSDARAADAAARTASSAGRSAGAAERSARAQELSAMHSDRTFLSGEMKKANDLIAEQLGATKLQDKTFDISSLDDPKLTKFRKASVQAGKLLRDGSAADFIDAVDKVQSIINEKPATTPTLAASGKFQAGKIYKDAKGNKAKWTGNGWQEVK